MYYRIQIARDKRRVTSCVGWYRLPEHGQEVTYAVRVKHYFVYMP